MLNGPRSSRVVRTQVVGTVAGLPEDRLIDLSILAGFLTLPTTLAYLYTVLVIYHLYTMSHRTSSPLTASSWRANSSSSMGKIKRLAAEARPVFVEGP